MPALQAMFNVTLHLLHTTPVVGYNIRFLILFSLKRLPYKITLINVELISLREHLVFSLVTH